MGDLQDLLKITIEASKGRCINESLNCDELLSERVLSIAAELGFDFCRCVYFVRDVLEASYQQYPDVRLYYELDNFPKVWKRIYDRRHYYRYDPMFTMGGKYLHARNLKYYAGSWKEVLGDYLAFDEAEKNQQKTDEVFCEAKKFQLIDGYFICVVQGESQVMASFASSQALDTFCNAATIDTLNQLTYQFFNAAAALSSHKCQSCLAMQKPLLTKKEQELLVHALTEKKSAKELAVMMGVSTPTVRFHINNIREKINRPRATPQELASFARRVNIL